MALDNAVKTVRQSILNTWNRGPSLRPLLTDLGPIVRGGESIDVPNRGSDFTVNLSESGSVAATSFGKDTMVVDRKKFINQAITQTQQAQLLGGNSKFGDQLAVAARGTMDNAIDKDIIDYVLSSAGTSAANHFNLDGGALSDGDINDCEAALREQDGIANAADGIFWLMNPRAQSKIKTVADFDAGARPPNAGSVGLPFIGMINGSPAYMHNAVPGAVESLRFQAVVSANTVATNVATLTVPAGHGFVAGQQVYTSGLTVDAGDADNVVAITSVTSTTVVLPLTAGDGANGAGVIYSGTAMAMLCYAPWIFYGLDGGGMPYEALVKREAEAGWGFQVFQHLGREVHAGCVKVVHTPV